MLRRMHRPRLRSTLVLVCSALACSSEPPDDSPMGQAIAALMERPEISAEKVKVAHVLIQFKGASRSDATRTREEARTLAAEIFARAQKGEDFTALMKKYSDDTAEGVYEFKRGDMVRRFCDVSFRLQVGEIGVAAHQASRCPYGWHVIKRLQ